MLEVRRERLIVIMSFMLGVQHERWVLCRATDTQDPPVMTVEFKMFTSNQVRNYATYFSYLC